MNWKQVGHILNRPSQLVNMEGQHVNGGIFAPAISYNPHNKTYYMVTTNVGAGNFFVKTQDPFGEWSDPIMLPEVTGIDPSFFSMKMGRPTLSIMMTRRTTSPNTVDIVPSVCRNLM